MPNMVHVQYTSDSGTVYQRRTLNDLVTPLGLTAEAVGLHQYLPRHIRPRYVLGRDPATGRQHKLRGVASTDAHFTGATTTITVPDPANRAGATLTLNIAGRMGERNFQP